MCYCELPLCFVGIVQANGETMSDLIRRRLISQKSIYRFTEKMLRMEGELKVESMQTFDRHRENPSKIFEDSMLQAVYNVC